MGEQSGGCVRTGTQTSYQETEIENELVSDIEICLEWYHMYFQHCMHVVTHLQTNW